MGHCPVGWGCCGCAFALGVRQHATFHLFYSQSPQYSPPHPPHLPRDFSLLASQPGFATSAGTLIHRVCSLLALQNGRLNSPTDYPALLSCLPASKPVEWWTLHLVLQSQPFFSLPNLNFSLCVWVVHTPSLQFQLNSPRSRQPTAQPQDSLLCCSMLCAIPQPNVSEQGVFRVSQYSSCWNVKICIYLIFSSLFRG